MLAQIYFAARRLSGMLTGTFSSVFVTRFAFYIFQHSLQRNRSHTENSTHAVEVQHRRKMGAWANSILHLPFQTCRFPVRYDKKTISGGFQCVKRFSIDMNSLHLSLNTYDWKVYVFEMKYGCQRCIAVIVSVWNSSMRSNRKQIWSGSNQINLIRNE